MPLDKSKLEQDLKSLVNEMKVKTEDTTDAYANKMAHIIDEYVKSADVVITGIVTAGSAATQTQTAPLTFKLS